jgi:alkyl hydroperoxide reductase subunit AhpC
LDAAEVSEATGAYYDPEKKFLQAAGFVIRPDNTVAVVCYSTGPIGRLVAKDVLNLIRFYKSRR